LGIYKITADKDGEPGKVFILEPTNTEGKHLCYNGAEPVEDKPSCFKMDFQKFRESFIVVTVCWYGAYKQFVDLPNPVPKNGYTIKTTKLCRDRNDVVVAVYEKVESYVKRKYYKDNSWSHQEIVRKFPVEIIDSMGKKTRGFNVPNYLVAYSSHPRFRKSWGSELLSDTRGWKIGHQLGEVTVKRQCGECNGTGSIANVIGFDIPSNSWSCGTCGGTGSTGKRLRLVDGRVDKRVSYETVRIYVKENNDSGITVNDICWVENNG